MSNEADIWYILKNVFKIYLNETIQTPKHAAPPTPVTEIPLWVIISLGHRPDDQKPSQAEVF